MDVSSLYPNIDHEEGVKACAYALNKRKTHLISTSFLTGLIMTVLKSNTLKFGERFFHQIKGTAMGTPMAVNFANLFMAKFETEMLADYKKKFKKLPTVWLRYIDDIFFTWDYDETSLKHFINFCNNYSSNQNMKSNITFTADYSTSEVYFLDTKIKFKGERLISELYSKPTASFQYLHRTSYHPPHTFRSIVKSQFIRIRRICSDIDDYWFHADRFSSFFRSRGFKLISINKIINDIAKTPRQTLFKSQNDTNTNLLLASRKSSRIPFVTTWHHKLSGFQSILHLHYREMIEQFPNLKCIFPEAPILSFRRNKNLRNQLVHTSLTVGTQKTSEQSCYSTPCLSKRGKDCKLCPFMSNTNVITNKLSHKSCYTSGGKCSTTDTIYAAECTRHSMTYVGHSSQKLNSLFNGHRSDVKVKPKACELSQHFHNKKECSIDMDLKAYILQDNVTGSWEKREYFEDRWITRLNSKAPNGMNSNLKEFAKTFYALF